MASAAFHTGTGHPHGKAMPVMIAARLAHALARRRAAKFTAPDEQRFVPQAGAFQIGNQRRDGLVGLARVQRVIRDAVVVTVPVSSMCPPPE